MGSRAEFDLFVSNLPREEQEALCNNHADVRNLARRLSGVLTRELDYTGGPGLVARLLELAAFGVDVSPLLTDANYPVTGEGVVRLRYRLQSGKKLMSGDGHVYEESVEKWFREGGLRRPNAAEALALPAGDPGFGRDGCPVVMFIRGQSVAFVLTAPHGQRRLRIDSDGGRWTSSCLFEGVCED